MQRSTKKIKIVPDYQNQTASAPDPNTITVTNFLAFPSLRIICQKTTSFTSDGIAFLEMTTNSIAACEMQVKT